MWQPLAANLFVAALAPMAWLALGEQVARLNAQRQRLAFAGAMTVATLASMALSFQLAPGVFFDFRSSLVALAAWFGGPMAALLVGGTALGYRVCLGGALVAGSLSIASAVGVGLVGRRLCRSVGWGELACLAAAVAVTTLLVPLSLPAAARAAWLPRAWAPVALSALCTLVMGGLLVVEARRRQQAAENAHFRAMVEALPDCLNIKDAEGRFIAANEATAALMRAPSAAALIGKTDFDFYPHELAARFRADEARVRSSGRHQLIDQERRFGDGPQHWLSTLKTPVLDGDGRVVAIVTHNRDVTAAKRVEAELAQTRGYLDEALANMGDGLAMYDSGGTLLFCNGRYQGMFTLTGRLRVPGARFDDVARAAVVLGEERLASGTSLAEHVAKAREALFEDGERVIGLADGRNLACRTKVLDSGCSLRVLSDVTERVSYERRLRHQALHDALTGLPNRAHFDLELARLLGMVQAGGGELVVMLVDLDRFKQVNDSHGHPVGDALLVEVSRRLERSVRRGDLVARIGGDEFAVLAHGATVGGAHGARLASRVLESLSRPVSDGGIVLSPSGTIGYTVYPHDDSGPEGLLRNADRALYRAKARRRGTSERWDGGTAGCPVIPVAKTG